MDAIDGSTYIGNFFRGLKHGHGKIVFSTGEQYDGEWQDDVFKG